MTNIAFLWICFQFYFFFSWWGPDNLGPCSRINVAPQEQHFNHQDKIHKSQIQKLVVPICKKRTNQLAIMLLFSIQRCPVVFFCVYVLKTNYLGLSRRILSLNSCMRGAVPKYNLKAFRFNPVASWIVCYKNKVNTKTEILKIVQWVFGLTWCWRFASISTLMLMAVADGWTCKWRMSFAPFMTTKMLVGNWTIRYNKQNERRKQNTWHNTETM